MILDNSDYCWYSEAFKICDCDVDGFRGGLNLIENGWFEDWSGAVDQDNEPNGGTA